MPDATPDIVERLADLRDRCTPEGFDTCHAAIVEIERLRSELDARCGIPASILNAEPTGVTAQQIRSALASCGRKEAP